MTIQPKDIVKLKNANELAMNKICQDAGVEYTKELQAQFKSIIEGIDKYKNSEQLFENIQKNLPKIQAMGINVGLAEGRNEQGGLVNKDITVLPELSRAPNFTISAEQGRAFAKESTEKIRSEDYKQFQTNYFTKEGKEGPQPKEVFKPLNTQDLIDMVNQKAQETGKKHNINFEEMLTIYDRIDKTVQDIGALTKDRPELNTVIPKIAELVQNYQAAIYPNIDDLQKNKKLPLQEALVEKFKNVGSGYNPLARYREQHEANIIAKLEKDKENEVDPLKVKELLNNSLKDVKDIVNNKALESSFDKKDLEELKNKFTKLFEEPDKSKSVKQNFTETIKKINSFKEYCNENIKITENSSKKIESDIGQLNNKLKKELSNRKTAFNVLKLNFEAAREQINERNNILRQINDKENLLDTLPAKIANLNNLAKLTDTGIKKINQNNPYLPSRSAITNAIDIEFVKNVKYSDYVAYKKGDIKHFIDKTKAIITPSKSFEQAGPTLKQATSSLKDKSAGKSPIIGANRQSAAQKQVVSPLRTNGQPKLSLQNRTPRGSSQLRESSLRNEITRAPSPLSKTQPPKPSLKGEQKPTPPPIPPKPSMPGSQAITRGTPPSLPPKPTPPPIPPKPTPPPIPPKPNTSLGGERKAAAQMPPRPDPQARKNSQKLTSASLIKDETIESAGIKQVMDRVDKLLNHNYTKDPAAREFVKNIREHLAGNIPSEAMNAQNLNMKQVGAIITGLSNTDNVKAGNANPDFVKQTRVLLETARKTVIELSPAGNGIKAGELAKTLNAMDNDINAAKEQFTEKAVNTKKTTKISIAVEQAKQIGKLLGKHRANSGDGKESSVAGIRTPDPTPQVYNNKAASGKGLS